MKFRINTRFLNTFITGIGYILLLLAGYFFLDYHYDIVTYPFLLELREGGMLLTTKALLSGINPYATSNLPQYLNVYGILYNILAIPAELLISNSLIAHKLTTAVFIVAIGYLFFKISQRYTFNKHLTFIGIITLYASCLILVIPLPRPETLGILLFLVCLYLPTITNYSNKGLHFAFTAGILSIFAKVYFVFCLPLLSLWLILFVDKTKGLRFTIHYLIITCITIALVHFIAPLYWINTLFINIGCEYPTAPHWRYFQIAVLRLQIFPVILIMLAILVLFAAYRFYKERKALNLSFKSSKPLIAGINHPFLFYTLCTALLFYYKMAENYGAFVYYAIELVFPSLILLTIYWLNRQVSIVKAIGFCLITYNLTFIYTYMISYGGFQNKELSTTTWQLANDLVEKHKHIFASPAITPLLIQHNRPVYDSGLTEWYLPCKDVTKSQYTSINELNIQYRSKIDSMLVNKQFDLIMIDMYGSWLINNATLQAHYERKEVLNFNLPHTGQPYCYVVWRPK